MNLIAIFIGGIIGGVFRYFLGFVIPCPSGFPLDILVINLVGSLALGALYGMAASTKMKLWLQNGIGTGIIGSFTTFSTFCVGTIHLAKAHAFSAIVYVIVSLSFGPLLAYIGERAVRWAGSRKETDVREVSA
ncbi:CrcB family protein [Alicyclobacillus fastidiosus]|uniref:Fluoride-specific ion channel FluC n=1 Tax=Alicyclobacillus fastidiosus TaxID=392011 RepID=A0ABY6ZLS0_9BACL|nr:CrcB family protein [Alicyclobacillus fastidiosus]WAH43845.1 CrcB family protein [Alicyclobacillus fastidiosus]GMA60080.1 chromosome condensation protein CcrB [Alicyclobacillus fastidiosus]